MINIDKTKKIHIQPANQPWRKYVCVYTYVSVHLSLFLPFSPYLHLCFAQYSSTSPNQTVPSFCFTPLSSAAAAAKSLQSCPTLCDPIDGSPRNVLSPANILEQCVLLNYMCPWGMCSVWTWTLAFH